MRFALTSSPVFSRTDTITDSEKFYTSILDLFEDIEEQEEVNDLLVWWNRYAFPPRFLYLPSWLFFALQTDFPQLFVGAASDLQEQCFGEDKGETIEAKGHQFQCSRVICIWQ